MSAAKPCKDCEPGSKRPAPHPGPRCYTHHLAFKKATKARAHDVRVQRVYGLNAGEYAELYRHQGGLCAICRVGRGLKKALAVDHDHTTGEVRGLLCGRCNYDLLGNYDAAALRRALDYLATPPKKVLDERRSGHSTGVNQLGTSSVRREASTEWWHGKHGLLPAEGMGDDAT